MYVANAFSLNMLDPDLGVTTIEVVPVGYDGAVRLFPTEFTSIIGHPNMAEIVSRDLGAEIPMNRVSVSLKKGDKVLVAQYRGPRLPEGATTLPEGASIDYLLVSIQ